MNTIHCCPYCGGSYYQELYHMSTLLAWTPIYKDGLPMNSDPNKKLVCCQCLSCGKQFSFEK